MLVRRGLNIATGELVMLGNDLTSLSKSVQENRAVDNHIVLVTYEYACIHAPTLLTARLRMLGGGSLEAAVDTTAAKFHAAVAELDSLASAVVAGGEHADLLRNYVDGLRAMVAGIVTVGCSTTRYKQYQVVNNSQRAPVFVEVKFF